VYAPPDPTKLRDFTEDIRDGALVTPVSRHMPLHDAGVAHALLGKVAPENSFSALTNYRSMMT
jgi:hypothetical protein